MVSAQIGPVTATMEALAAAIGAGILLGGFLAGSAGMMLRWPRVKAEAWTLVGGNIGGSVALLAILVELRMR
jgi:hypothetical protein